MDVPTIHTERLDLVSISPEWTEALLQGRRDEAARLGGFGIPDGWPDEQATRRHRIQQQEMRENANRQEWLARAIGQRSSGELIGRTGFHEPHRMVSRR